MRTFTPCIFPKASTKLDSTQRNRATSVKSGCNLCCGGNTRSMLAVWQEWNLDVILKKAWHSGVLLGGMSAGALCWFEYGGSDSTGIAGIDRIFPLQGLGFLNGSCTPHYDNELNRRPDLHQLIIGREIPAGVGIDDGAAVLFEGQQVVEVVSSRVTSKAYQVSLDNDRVVEQELLTRYLG